MINRKTILTTLIAMLAAGTVIAQEPSSRTKARRSISSGNMKQLGLALLGYTGDYRGVFPETDGVAGWNRLIDTNDLPLSKVYLNPRDAVRVAAYDGSAKKLTEKACSYAYVGGGLRDDNVNSTTMPVAWEKPCGDGWCNVLYVDGHVSGYPGTFNSHVAIVKVLKKQNNWSDKQYKFYLKKAQKMDEAFGLAVEKLPKETVKELDALIAQLGADDFKTRRKAQKELKKHVPKAYQYLKKAHDKSDDPEVQERLKALMYAE